MNYSYVRGWLVYYDGEFWRYQDNGKVVDDDRPCKRCGEKPTEEGYDACKGHVKGGFSICCGHGAHEPVRIMAQEQIEKAISALGLVFGEKEGMAALARVLGVSRSQVGRWKNGVRPRQKYIDAICELAATADEFVRVATEGAERVRKSLENTNG